MKQKSVLIPNVVIGIIMVLFALPLFIFREIPSYEVPAFIYDCNKDWDSELGKMDLTHLRFRSDGTITLTRMISPGEVRSGDLCLTSTNVSFIVYVDERMVYRYEPELPWIYGRSYGNDIHAIPVSTKGKDCTLRLEVTSLKTGRIRGFRDAHFENGSDYVRHILSSRLTHYYMTAVIFTFSFVIFVMGWFFRKGNSRRLETISLGVLGMLFSLWTESSDYTIVLLTGHAGLIRIISYYSLMFLPIPGITLICHLTHHPKSMFQKIVTALVAMNLILHITLLYLEVWDYHQMLYFTHGTLILTIIFIIFAIVRGFIQKSFSTHSSRILLSAFLILTITGILDIILFYCGHSARMANYSRLGFLIFVAVVGSYEIREFVRMLQSGREAEMMKHLAHRDGLTGLENRLAFTEWEQNLRHLKKGACIFVQFDINNLKEVNDHYGHNAGDAFIIAGANAIRQAFGPYGRVFRTGGDEFVCVLTTAAPSSTETLAVNNDVLINNNSPAALMKCYEACEQHLIDLLNSYNMTSGTPIPLTIAFGMAEYDLSQGNPEPQERLADERMYMHKNILKGKQAL